jgi:hypothetical protein
MSSWPACLPARRHEGLFLGATHRSDGLKHFIPATLGGSAAANSLLIGTCDGVTVGVYLGVQMAAARALDRRSRVLLKHLGAGEALVVFRDRRQHLRELPGLAIGLEFLRRDQLARLVNVSLEH